MFSSSNHNDHPLIVKHTYFIVCLITCLLCSTHQATAAAIDNIRILGDAGVSYESNVYYSNTDETSEWASFISPTIIYTSTSNINQLSISYNPEYIRNHRRNTYTLYNDVDLSFNHRASNRLSYNFSNNFNHASAPGAETTASSMSMNFVRIDPAQQVAIVNLLFYDVSWPDGEFDPMNPAQVAFVQTELQVRYDAASPEIQSEVDGIMNQSTERYQYWSNISTLDGFYQYDRNNLISFGYSYRTTHSDADYLSQNNTHSPYISLQHIFSPEFEFLLAYHFSSIKSDLSNDSSSHLTSLRTTYTIDHARQFYVEYGNKQVDFDGSQTSQTEHRLDMGYDHTFNQRTSFNFTGQPFLLERKSRADERGYIIDATLTHLVQHGKLSLNGRTNVSDLKTTGTWDPFRKAWVVKTTFDYQFSQKLKTNIFTSYGKTQSWYLKSKSTYSIYTGGIETSYPLNKWLDLDLEYRYTLLNSDNLLIDESTNNKITLTISAADDLWRW